MPKISNNNQEWKKLNKEAFNAINNCNWGLYSNARFNMWEILKKEGKLKEALTTYMEVCYLDLNGATNTWNISDPKLLKKYPPFDYKNLSFLAPGILERIKKIMKKLQLTEKNIKKQFIKNNNKIYKNLKLPLSPKKCIKPFIKGIKETNLIKKKKVKNWNKKWWIIIFKILFFPIKISYLILTSIFRNKK